MDYQGCFKRLVLQHQCPLGARTITPVGPAVVRQLPGRWFANSCARDGRQLAPESSIAGPTNEMA